MTVAAKTRKSQAKSSTEIVSARLRRPALSTLRKLYPGRSNQAIIETLVEEKLARRDFDSWLSELKRVHQSGDLDLEKV
jgi:hypothetical protein